jgi:2-oxoglutarate ferredoxin oxidoreductase subunit delta
LDTKRDKKTTKIGIYKAWCKGCGICVAFCPADVLIRDDAGYPYVKSPEKCINCGWCELRCPDFAITVYKKDKGLKEIDEEGEKERLQGTPAPGQ